MLWPAIVVSTACGIEVEAAAPLLARFCADCHGADDPEAHLNLQQLAAQPDFATQFRTWEKVIERLRDGRMPPPESPQPTGPQRQALVSAVANGLETYIKEHDGDPGRVIMRRLTSAEYAYSIKDLTGQELIDPHDFVSDAAASRRSKRTRLERESSHEHSQDEGRDRIAARILARLRRHPRAALA